MNRRDFFKKTAILSVAAGAAEITRATELLQPTSEPAEEGLPITASEDAHEGALIISAPMLQNYAETSIGIAFAVSDLANAYVVIGRQPDLTDGRKVLCGGYRMSDLDDRVVQVRITGLEPATTYYYRIGADRIEYKDGYHMKNLGTEEEPVEATAVTTTFSNGSFSRLCRLNSTHCLISSLMANLPSEVFVKYCALRFGSKAFSSFSA